MIRIVAGELKKFLRDHPIDGGKKLEELGDGIAIIEIIQEALCRHASTAKNQGSTHEGRI
jgi:hypothetical protein